MSEYILLNWAIMATSLFNAILLFWLGLTVIFNSERRDWGVRVATAALLLAALFFVSHTAIVGLGLSELGWWSMIFWWSAGMIPVIVLPFFWYIIMLWYSGYWQTPAPALQHRQRAWFWLTVTLLIMGLLTLGLTIVLLVVPAPTFVTLRELIRWSIFGVPFLAVGYSLYVLLCIGLSIDAVRGRGRSPRMMGQEARRRAQPWLAATAIVLLVVSLVVVATLVWVVQNSQSTLFLDVYVNNRQLFAVLDLIVSALISTSTVLTGQAIVSYEVFTGKTLPRRGFFRIWRRTLVFAVGYALLVGGTIAVRLQPLYSLLLTTLLMTFFYALIGWRSYLERERHIANLRPFVTGQHLLQQLLAPSSAANNDLFAPFAALCANVLEAKVAYLSALGPLAPLVGNPLIYYHDPQNLEVSPRPPSLTDIAAQFTSPDQLLVPLEPHIHGEAHWGIPLWSERGLSGVILLGEKEGGGLYTQEEIEIARNVGERLIDTQASAEMGRRLMSLQRQRLAQSQIIDQQTRRVMHDDILPSIQAAMIALSGVSNQGQEALQNSITQLTTAHKQISDLLHDMPTVSVPEIAHQGLIPALQKNITAEFDQQFSSIQWEISPVAAEETRQIPILAAEVVFYAVREAVRNAAKHGRGAEVDRRLNLTLHFQWQEGLQIVVDDDGVGADTTAQPESGSGQGLALHSTMMAVIGGMITVDTKQNQFTRVTFFIPRENFLLEPEPISLTT